MDFLKALTERVRVAEGAMGTRLFSKGIAPGTCLEELNLSRPALIREIHQEYREAGAEIFKSNTFGANPVRLARHDLAEKCRAMNMAGVRIAKAVAGDAGGVAGVVGPLGEKANPNASQSFAIQIAALAEGGADCILLETFRNLDELEAAIHAAREVCNLPVVAQVSPDEQGNLEDGLRPEEFVPKLSEWGADAIGCNCGAGLAGLLETVRRMARLTAKPLTAQPSAGLPFIQQSRTVYPYSPEEIAEAAEHLLESGVRLLGGCCGTMPEHIAAIQRTVRSRYANPILLPPARATGGERWWHELRGKC